MLGLEPLGTPSVVSPQRCFLEGVLSNVLNPKVAIFTWPSSRSLSVQRTS